MARAELLWLREADLLGQSLQLGAAGWALVRASLGSFVSKRNFSSAELTTIRVSKSSRSSPSGSGDDVDSAGAGGNSIGEVATSTRRPPAAGPSFEPASFLIIARSEPSPASSLLDRLPVLVFGWILRWLASGDLFKLGAGFEAGGELGVGGELSSW